MCSQILLNKVVKQQFSRNAIWTGTPGKLSFWANDSPVWLRNWRSDFLHSYLIACELFCSSLSLKNVIFCSILLFYDTFYRKIFTNIVYECLVCTTTSKKHNLNIFFKNETIRKQRFVEVLTVRGLTCLALWQQFTLCFRPPGKSGFQVARCIAVHSNNFSYDMKAKWNTKIHFQPKTGRWNSWGELSCFRGTST